jgi:hypothetical protein
LKRPGGAAPLPINNKGGCGKSWNKYTIRDMLIKPVYTGTAAYGRKHQGKYHAIKGGTVETCKAKKTKNGQDKQVDNDMKDWTVREDKHPAIVDKDLFERVNRKLVDNRLDFKQGDRAKRHSHEWPLSGLAYCGHCGSLMWGVRIPAGRGGDRQRKYACSGYLEKGRDYCSHNTILESDLMPMLFGAIQEALAGDDTIRRLEERIRVAQRRRAKTDAGQLASLRKKADNLAARIKGGLEKLAMLPADMVDDMTREVRGWKAERETIVAQIRKLDDQSGEEVEQERVVQCALAAFHRLRDIVSQADTAEARAAAQALIENVELHFDHEEKGKRRGSQFVWGMVHFKDPLSAIGGVELRLQDGEAYDLPCP